MATMINSKEEIKVSFGYQCNVKNSSGCSETSDGYKIQSETKLQRTSSSFTCLSGAALSANATLANTNICNGLLGTEILPSWDSPKSFRKVLSSPSLSRLDVLSSSLHSSISNLSCSPSTQSDSPDFDSSTLNSTTVPCGSKGFINSTEVQVAGGAAGEDRVQAVCSEEDGWLFCSIYDGFNGRDAADFLAGTMYETIGFFFSLLDRERNQDCVGSSNILNPEGCVLQHKIGESNIHREGITALGFVSERDLWINNFTKGSSNLKLKASSDSFRQGVLDSLLRSLVQAESDFLQMVEQEMEDRPDLVCVGSCVLIVLLFLNDLYTISLGDSRAVLATYGEGAGTSIPERLKAIQLTESHTVDNEAERHKLLSDHPDDPTTIVAGKVKGKLKVTRAFGVAYLKKKEMNDVLMGILRVRDLQSPPYISSQPSLNVHKITKSDHFVIIGSDGLFDFFTNDEAVQLVHSYVSSNPSGDPAKYLVEQLVVRAADCAGFSMEELMSVPAGRRRKYHDDVTVMVIILGRNQRTSKATVWL